ncbi:MAG: DNA primase [Armatimonadetes bacterium]|nr:DNA primase [Armatimonadota bacterium]MDW8121844.1 DNA primase [Armatimonadota bacterium]
MTEASLPALIRERLDPVEVVGRYVTLIRAGRHYKALCPFHQEKTPSFYLSAEKGLWYCFGCGAGGTVLDFVQKIEGLTFSDTLAKLAGELGIPYRPTDASATPPSARQRLLQINLAAQHFFRWSLRNSSAPQEYLRKRMIGPEIADRFGLGYAPSSWDLLTQFLRQRRLSLEDGVRVGVLIRSSDGRIFDRFRHRLMFPIHALTGEIIGFAGRSLGDEEPKYLNVPESPLFQKRQNLYGLHLARQAIRTKGRAIIVEGYLDCITLHQAGFSETVATMGTALTGSTLQLLKRYTDRLFIAFDADSAGWSAILRSSDLFHHYDLTVFVVPMPPGTDPDSLVRESGSDAFAKAFQEAEPLVAFRARLFLKDYPKADAASLQAASRLLRSVHRPSEQEETIEILSKEWGRDRPERIAGIRQALYRSLLRQWTGRSDRADGHLKTALEPDPITAALTDVSELPAGVAGREEDLMAALLQDEEAAGRIFSLMTPDHFLLSHHRELASLAFSYLQSDRFSELGKAIEDLSDEEIKKTYFRLMVRDLSFLKAKNAIEDRIALHQRYRSEREVKRLLRELHSRMKEGILVEDRFVIELLRSLKS